MVLGRPVYWEQEEPMGGDEAMMIGSDKLVSVTGTIQMYYSILSIQKQYLTPNYNNKNNQVWHC
jgi:hypothetical protein